MFERNKKWLILTFSSLLISSVIAFVDLKLAIKVSVYLGLLFLILTLVPNNLAKLIPSLKASLTKFTSHKRDFGVTSAFLFLFHSLLSWKYYSNFDLKFLVEYNTIFGLLAIFIFILLLLTSNRFSINFLKKNWKRLQILVWLAVPLAFAHSNLSGLRYEQNLPILGVIGFGLIMLLAVVQAFTKKWIHLALIVAGFLINISVLSVFYPNALTPTTSETKDTQTAIPASPSRDEASPTNSNTNTLTSPTSNTNTLTSPTSNTSELTESTPTTEDSNQVPTSTPTTDKKTTFSLAELSTHSTNTDCYIAFEKKVYDVTEFLKRHPGGVRSIQKFCGKEIDSVSSTHAGGSFAGPDIQDTLTPFLVGELR